uniref:Uncharacterized protein n=1 Tax=Arundo donax TaxID=35708 RepID=A0A0A9CF00_ARUDO
MFDATTVFLASRVIVDAVLSWVTVAVTTTLPRATVAASLVVATAVVASLDTRLVAVAHALFVTLLVTMASASATSRRRPRHRDQAAPSRIASTVVCLHSSSTALDTPATMALGPLLGFSPLVAMPAPCGPGAREPTLDIDSPTKSLEYKPTTGAAVTPPTSPCRILFFRLENAIAGFGTEVGPQIFASGLSPVTSFMAAGSLSTTMEATPTAPPASALPHPSFLFGTMVARCGAPPFYPAPKTKVEDAAPSTSVSPSEGTSAAPTMEFSTPTTPSGCILRCFATANRRPGLHSGSWSPVALGFY